nr:glutamic acid-rich protein-like [Tanacetum cinerariifolium]
MALGKDKSNPLLADNLPKIVWSSTHHITIMKSWLVQKQMALGKDKSNPLMADNLPKIVWYSTHHITLMKSCLVQKQTALGKDKSNPLTVDSLLKTIWLSIHHHLTNEVLNIPGQIATEATIRDVLCLDDADGVNCLPNEEIFAELDRMGYKKPSTKLTLYKAFFSSQWKFLIHTILQSMSAKRTSWNEFSSAMASAVICLSTGRKFNFSKYTFESLVRNVDSSSKFYMYPRFIQLIIKNQLGVETPLFEGMLVGVIEEEGDTKEQVKDVDADIIAQGADTAAIGDVVQDQSIISPTSPPQQPQDLPSTSQANKVKVLKLRRLKKVGTSQRIASSDDTVMKDASNQGRIIDALDSDAGVALMDDKEEGKKAKEAKVVGDDQVKGRQAEIYKINMDHALKVLCVQEDEPKVQEVVDVVTTAKLITEVVTAASESVTAASTTIVAAEPQVPDATVTAALV